MSKIAYLTNPEELLSKLDIDNPSEYSEVLLNSFDYAGGIILPEKVVRQIITQIPCELASKILQAGNANKNTFHCRSQEYYLNYTHQDDTDKVRKALVKGIKNKERDIDLLAELDLQNNLETRLLAASILDHKKHYSMCIFNAIFSHSLENELSPHIYESAKENCKTDIASFYRFLLTGQISEQNIMSDDVITAFENEITLPKPTPPSLKKVEGEPTARKIIIREMDHPMQIILFAGQILDQDESGTIDFVLNPLNGALEIGYALKAIYETAGVEKVDETILIKYSRYGESHTVQDKLDSFVPQHKREELHKLIGRRIFVIDDNTAQGNTLNDIRSMCYKHTSRVGIAAIERMTNLEGPRAISFEELDIPPISKLRYVERVMNYIKRNNLSELINPKTPDL